MTKVIAHLGLPEVVRTAGTIGRRKYSERIVYKWADPDSGTLPSLPIALAFDTAYQLAGGEDAPFRDAFGQQLGIAVERQDACRRALVADQIDFIREAADLSTALIDAAQPGASPLAHHRALVEVQQVDGVLRRLRQRLPVFLRSAMSSEPGNAGGTILP